MLYVDQDPDGPKEEDAKQDETKACEKRGNKWLKLFDALARVARPSDDQGLV